MIGLLQPIKANRFLQRKIIPALQKLVQGEPWCFSTIRVPCLTLKTNLAQAIAHRKKNHAKPKDEKKIHAPGNCQPPPPPNSKSSGPSL